MVRWRFNRNYDRTHGPRRRNNLFPGTYYIGTRRSDALWATPGSASNTYSALYRMGQRTIISRAIRRIGSIGRDINNHGRRMQALRRAAGNIRMARLIRRQALDSIARGTADGGLGQDVARIVESFIPSNQITQRATAADITPTVTAVPAGRAAIVMSAAFPANHHSGNPVSNPRRGVGVNTNTLRQISGLYQSQTGGNVFYNKLN